MRTSQRGIDLIKRWEGFKKIPYYCSAGVLTVFWGHTRTARDYVGNTLTDNEARIIGERLLKEDIAQFERQVLRLVQVPLTQPQFDALLSFTYNLGGGALERSTLLKKLNRGDYKGAAKQFDVWINADGKRVQGLVSRRADERRMFEEFAVPSITPAENNTPMRNRDLPLPTAMQEGLEVGAQQNIANPAAIAVGGTAALGGAVEVATNLAPALSPLSYLDWRVGVVIVIVAAIGGAIWWWKKR